ncbi:DNA ligase [Hyaloraphidium curvatum]|nr:DNA ligase [Hyaloraphidium curvatum]
MPPKGAKRAAPSPAKKRGGGPQAGQTRLDSFFASPAASPAKADPRSGKPPEVVDLDSDGDAAPEDRGPPVKRAKIEGSGSNGAVAGGETVAGDTGTADVSRSDGEGRADEPHERPTEPANGASVVVISSSPTQAAPPNAAPVAGVSSPPTPPAAPGPASSSPGAAPALLTLTAAAAGPGGTHLTAKPFSYDPHHPFPDWPAGGPAPYSFCASAFAAVAAEKGRTASVSILANAFRTLLARSPADVIPFLYLCSNRIAPSYEGIELGVGAQVMTKAIREATGAGSDTLKALYDRLGDLGDVAMELRVKQRTLFAPKPLSVRGVYAALRKIAGLSGQGAVEEKANLVKGMLVAARGEEIRYLTRTLISHIRIGATKVGPLTGIDIDLFLMSPSALDSTDDGAHGPRPRRRHQETVRDRAKRAEASVKEVFARLPNYDILVPRLLDPAVGPEGLPAACSCEPGVPIRPMLGRITRDLAEALAKIEGRAFAADYKYDGMRAQVHRMEGGGYRIFSRNLEDVTARYPDIVSALRLAERPGTGTYIMDAEVVAWDPAKQHILPFQTLTNRPRKAVKEEELKERAKVFAFDLMYLDGESLLRTPLRGRLEKLDAAFDEVPDRFAQVRRMRSVASAENHDTVLAFLSTALEEGAEGLMLKLLDDADAPAGEAEKRGQLVATYEADRRTDSWLKVKRDYDAGFRTFDLVVMGAWWGNGRKKGWYSPFLLGCWNPDTEQIEAVCKAISGFSDDFYKKQLSVFSEESGLLAAEKKPYYVTPYECDLWFEPSVVWEIRGADLTLSPVHTAARGLASEDRGVSMRFPRFVRVRDDKGVEEATTSAELAEAYSKQVLVANQEKSRAGREAEGEADEGEEDEKGSEADGDD